MTDDLRTQVRDRYAEAALAVTTGTAGGCCGGDAGCGPTGSAVTTGSAALDENGEAFGAALYSGDDLGDLPEEAVLASPRLRQPARRRRPACRASGCSTSARAAASTCCSRPAGSGPTGSRVRRWT